MIEADKSHSLKRTREGKSGVLCWNIVELIKVWMKRGQEQSL